MLQYTSMNINVLPCGHLNGDFHYQFHWKHAKLDLPMYISIYIHYAKSRVLSL